MKWHKYPEIAPPDIPESENFGIEYDVKYKLPNGRIETTTTEWLYDKTWNCIYPVIAWKEHQVIIPFKPRKA